MAAVFVIEQTNFFYAFKISFAISGYLEAKFDYDYLALGSHVSTQEISSHFEQN